MSGSLLSRLARGWKSFETVLVGLLVVGALVIYLYGAVVRTLLPSLAIDWAEEVAIYLIVWATLLCGGMLAAERKHVAAGIASRFLPERALRIHGIAVELVTLAFCVVMAILGAQGVLFAHALDERSASTLQVPQAFALYLALPIGMALIAIRIALLLLGPRADSAEPEEPGPVE